MTTVIEAAEPCLHQVAAVVFVHSTVDCLWNEHHG